MQDAKESRFGRGQRRSPGTVQKVVILSKRADEERTTTLYNPSIEDVRVEIFEGDLDFRDASGS